MPTLREQAMLASIRLTGWANRRQHKALSHEVVERHNMKKGRARVNTDLVAPEALDGLNLIDSRIRAFHDKMTLPWWSNGTGLLTTDNWEAYIKGMAEFRLQRETEVSSLVQMYPTLVKAAEQDMGDAFDATLYPDAQDIAAKYTFEVIITAIPDAPDVRCLDLPQEEIDRIEEETEKRIAETLAASTADLYARLHKTLSESYNRVKEFQRGADGKSVKTFRDSAVDNLRNAVIMLPKLLVVPDAGFAAVIADVDASLCRLDAEDLRMSDYERQVWCQHASRILAIIAPIVAV